LVLMMRICLQYKWIICCIYSYSMSTSVCKSAGITQRDIMATIVWMHVSTVGLWLLAWLFWIFVFSSNLVPWLTIDSLVMGNLVAPLAR
jgi:hypothetical protein